MANPIVSGQLGLTATLTGTQASISVGDAPTLSVTIGGGIAPYVVQIVGTLPPGRTLSGTTVSGAFITAGSYAYTILTTDAAANQVSIPINVTVAASTAPTLPSNVISINSGELTLGGDYLTLGAAML